MKKILLFALLLFSVKACAQNGFYAVYDMEAPMNTTGSVKLQHWNKHSRMEMNMNGAMGAMKMVMLSRGDKPGKVILINDAQKAYSEMDAGSQNGPDGNKDCQVTVLGPEKVGTYNCKRVSVVQGGNKYDLWISADNPEFVKYAWGSGGLANDKLYKALQAKGVKGYPVKIVHHSKDGTATLTLSKAGTQAYTEANFKVPAGYKQNNMAAMPEGATQQLTPEQKKMMEEYMNQQKH